MVNFARIGPILPDQPHEALGSGVGLSLELAANQVLDVIGVDGGCEVSLADFLTVNRVSCVWRRPSACVGYLNVAKHILLNGGEGDGSEEVFVGS